MIGKISRLFLSTAIALLLLLAIPLAGRADMASYPRLANYYLTSWITDSEARQLAKWDVVVLGFEIPVTSPNPFRLLKQLNPDIVLLAYIDSIMKHGSAPMVEPIRTQFFGTKDEWLLRSPEKTPMSFWPGTSIVNPTDFVPAVGGKRWNDFLPEFTVQTITNQPGWDGIFFDDAMADIAWLNYGNIDINADGTKDSPIFIDDAWRGGMNKMFANARTRAGAGRIIVANSSNAYSDHTNGRMFENYFTDKGSWLNQVSAVNDAVQTGGYQPRYVLINANTENRGDWQDWQKFRYAYVSGLMTDAYVSYDHGDAWHQQLWWYDEYGVTLGRPIDGAHVVAGQQGSPLGVWRRDFEQGIALINSTGAVQQITLHEEFWKIAGTQDVKHNDGSLVSSISLSPYDGIVLTRTVPKLAQPPTAPLPPPPALPVQGGSLPHQAFINGNAAYVYSAIDGALAGSSELRAPELRTGEFGMTDDLDNDGQAEIITYDRGALKVRRGNTLVWQVRPYDQAWSGRVGMVSGNVTGDAKREIVIVAGKGGGPHVRVVGSDGKIIGNGFFAGDPASRGGASIALADLDNDQTDEIIIGSGQGVQPRVAVYDAQGNMRLEFIPYDQTYRGGVNVGAGDIDSDGRADIFTGPMGAGETRVKIFSAAGILAQQFSITVVKPEEGVRVLWWNFPPYILKPGQFLIDSGPILNFSPDAPLLEYQGR